MLPYAVWVTEINPDIPEKDFVDNAIEKIGPDRIAPFLPQYLHFSIPIPYEMVGDLGFTIFGLPLHHLLLYFFFTSVCCCLTFLITFTISGYISTFIRPILSKTVFGNFQANDMIFAIVTALFLYLFGFFRNDSFSKVRTLIRRYIRFIMRFDKFLKKINCRTRIKKFLKK